MDSASAIGEFNRVYLALFYSFVAAFYTVRILAMKRSGLSDVVFPGATYCASWWNHMIFRAFRITIWLVCLVRWPYPQLDAYLGTIAALERAPVLLAGTLLLTAGFLFTVFVHFDLGRQWRSGVDPGGPEELHTTGPYRFTRNPMFVGVATAQVGFFLALPSLFTLLCLGIGFITLRRQIRVEEAHLEAKFDDAYARYRDRVRRWI